MKLDSFRDLFLIVLSDIYSVENQLVTELPRVAKTVHSDDLRDAVLHHFEETKNHVKRLDKVFKLMGENPKRTDWSRDIKNLFIDAEHFLNDNELSPILDTAIILILQRVEHFEIATYGTLKEFADVVGDDEIKSILNDILKEETKADATLTKLAKGGIFSSGINVEAVQLKP